MTGVLVLTLLVGMVWFFCWLLRDTELERIEANRQAERARIRHEQRRAEATISHLTANAMQQMTDAAQAAQRMNPKSKR